MIDTKKLISDLNKVFSPTSESVKQLEQMIQSYSQNQQANIAYFVDNGLEWNSNATPEDVQNVLQELKQFQEQVHQEETDGLVGVSTLCGIILNNLPYQTNLDVAKLKSRIQVAKLGIDTAKHLQQEQNQIEEKTTSVIEKHVKPVRVDNDDELAQKIASFNSHHGYHPVYKQRALMRIAWQNATPEKPINLIFRHMQQLAVDLDNIIDYAVKNHVNWNAMTKQYEKLFNASQQDNLSQGKWRSTVAKEYMSTQANLKRVFVTECKARQTQVAAKDYQVQGYNEVEVVSRHSSHVCSFCITTDGNIVKIDEMEQGINVPPFHPNCCCNVIPVANMDYDDVLNELNI
ncbi:minor capsid protein [Ligilactobacillus aviarius]|uniref:minor capsid protein n=1 Tax=Ligilactobacillus aviarius TaxID=1606 RepID=UPI00249F5CD1|nr:minor capsid protein [Ligilactobacillus aviarius]